jgi:hypothetical protein
VHKFAAKLGLSAFCPGLGISIALRFGGVALVGVVLLSTSVVPRASAAVRDGADYMPLPSIGPGPSFAVADFDGDRRPDFVSVEGGQIGSSSTRYWIQFRLTASESLQSIQLVAPPGGLVIEARDVNGDHTVDLVLTTAWFKQAVAVFLNDGHGKFSRAEPSQFPEAFTDAQRTWGSSFDHATGAAGIPSQPRSGVRSDAQIARDGRTPAQPMRAYSSEFVFDFLLLTRAGRAPPSKNS